MVPKKTLLSKLHTYHHCSENWCNSETSWLIAKAWWKIWKPGENLVKTWWISKTGWTLEENPGEFPIPGEFPKLGEFLVISKTWWKLGEFQNLVKTLVNVKTWWIFRCSPNERSVLRTEGFWNACCIHVCCLPKITNKQLNISCWLCANLHTMSCSRSRLDTNSRAKRVASAPLPNQTARLSRCCGKRV